MIPFNDIKTLIEYFNYNYVNTELLMKVNSFNLQRNDIWNVVENSQVLSLPNIDRLEQTYELFTNSRIDIEYIQWKSFDISLKIYVEARRFVFTTTNTLDIEMVYSMGKNMDIKNIVITMKL